MVLAEVPRPKLGVASGAFNTFRQFGFVIGVAVLISLFSGQVKDKTVQARTAAIQDVQQAANLPDATKAQIINGLQSSANSGGSGRGVASNPAANQNANTPIGQQISREFKKALVDAFTVCWFACAMIALFGVIPALFTHAPNHATSKPVDKEAAAHAVAG